MDEAYYRQNYPPGTWERIQMLKKWIESADFKGIESRAGSFPGTKKIKNDTYYPRDEYMGSNSANHIITSLLPKIKVTNFYIPHLATTEEERKYVDKQISNVSNNPGANPLRLPDERKYNDKYGTNYGDVLRQWEITLFPHHTQIIEESLIDTLVGLGISRLSLIAGLIIPNQLLSQHSKTYMGVVFTLLTGIIVTPENDPTVNRDDFKKLDIFEKDDLSMFQTKYEDAMQIYDEGYIAPRLNSYSFILQPSLRPLLNLAIEGKELPFFSYDDQHGSRSREQKKKIHYTYVEKIGVAVKIYSDYGLDYFLYGIRRLYGTFLDMLPYLLHKLYYKPRHRLPYSFSLDDIAPARKYLQTYSDTELVDMYYPLLDKGKFTSHYDLVNNIYPVYLTGVTQWYRVLNSKSMRCSNDNRLNIIEGEIKAIANKDAPDDDPVIYYGYYNKGTRKRCFRVSELEGNFRDTEYGFEFLDPDWEADTNREDPMTGEQLQRTMPKYMLRNLKRFTKDTIDRNNPKDVAIPGFRALLDKITTGELRQRELGISFADEQQKIDSHPEWRNDLLIYFTWVFLFAMWIRFWKGPGTPYTAVWEDKHLDSCDALRRDEHINIELSIHGVMLDRLEREKPELANYIKQLPYYHYTWSAGMVSKPDRATAIEIMKTDTVEGIINLVQLSEFCMAQATDLLAGSSFVYMTKVLKVDPQRINELLLFVMKLMYQYELDAINSRESVVKSIPRADAKSIEDLNISLSVISEHRRALDVVKLDFIQQPLDLEAITFTGHLPEVMMDLLGEA